MVSEPTHNVRRRRRPWAALPRLARLGDVPVVVMLAWAGWLAVPWSLNGLAQARAAAAAAAEAALPAESAPAATSSARPGHAPWLLPAASHAPATTASWPAAHPGVYYRAPATTPAPAHPRACPDATPGTPVALRPVTAAEDLLPHDAAAQGLLADDAAVERLLAAERARHERAAPYQLFGLG